jgi:hypothetical protein
LNRKPDIIKLPFGKLARLKLDRRVMVFLFFLTVSAVFWFLSALGREYTTNLQYPVRYTNFPENVVLVGELPSNFNLTVNAFGYTLVKHNVSRRLQPIVFDVGSFSLNRLPDTETTNFYVPSAVARSRIAGQLGAEIEILDIRPDTLFFRFSEMVSRRLPVRPVLDLEFQPQFMISGNIAIEPDSVTVSGPEPAIDTMTFIPTQMVSIRNINESVRRTIPLQDFDKLTISESRVLVSIPVEQFTEAGVRVTLEIVNLPDTLVMKTFPSEVTVYYHVTLTDYEKVSPHQFRAVVDYKNASPDRGRLEVSLVKHPEFISSFRFYPRTVDYLIEK